MRMNSSPMRRRLTSGSLTPATAARNSRPASTTSRFSNPDSRISAATVAVSFLRMKPLSMCRPRTRSLPRALFSSRKQTLESTPPLTNRNSLRPAQRCRSEATDSAMKFSIVQVRSHPHRSMKLSRIRIPGTVWVTSGWNCMPQMRRSGSPIAATGQSPVSPRRSNPGGISATVSRWLIQIFSTGDRPSSTPEAESTRSDAAPNSMRSPGSTRPPRWWQSSWWP